MKTTVIIAEDYRCVGSCAIVFNEQGKCVEPELPWVTVKDFELADEQAEHLTADEFYSVVKPDTFVEGELDGHMVEYLMADGVYVIYDADTNRHYFFI
jgi:hypothetical protein